MLKFFADCKCNGFIDNVGGGECRQHNYGHWWCYVDSENNCPDSQKDNTMPMFSRSSNACSPGLKQEIVRLYYLHDLLIGPCECNTFKFKKLGTRDICMNDIFDDDRFCYVPLESRCKDKRASKFFPSVYWSLKACSGEFYIILLFFLYGLYRGWWWRGRIWRWYFKTNNNRGRRWS